MKNKKISSAQKSAPKGSGSKPEQAVGGQPENDQDARDAGLKSAASGKAAPKKAR